MELHKRTADEISAYVDGYNESYKQFCECLKVRRSVMDAVRKMGTYVDIVNHIALGGADMRGKQNETDRR